MTAPVAEGLSARDHALRVAVAESIADVAAKARKHARGEAEAMFAGLREDGQTQQKVVLPSGEEIGLITIKAGGTAVEVDDEDALLSWVDEHCPGEAEEYVNPDAITNADLVEVVKAVFPELVSRRVRLSARKAFIDEMAENKGALTDKVTGEKAFLATVSTGRPTGAFSYRPATGATERVAAEWLAGRLPVDLGGPLALPGGEP